MITLCCQVGADICDFPPPTSPVLCC